MQDQDNVISLYKVKQATFEGPLELLLELIEKRKLFVNEVSLAQVTEEYISFVKSFSNVSVEKKISDISYFILIAATLLLIKSKSLLPNLELTVDEKDKIVDLESRLKLYQIIKNASLDIKNNFGVSVIFSPVERIWSEPLFSPDAQMTTSVVFSCIKDVINNAPKKQEALPEVEVKKVIQIDEIIESLAMRIENTLKTSFSEFSKSFNAKDVQEQKVHIIVSFLAMLELVREGIVDVMQNNSFEDITIEKQKIQNI